LVQQSAQGVVHEGLAFPRRQVQNLQVFSGRPPRTQALAQGVVGEAKAAGGEQLVAVHVVGQGAGLAEQRVDHVPVVDVALAAPAEPRQALDLLPAQPDLQALGIEPHLDLPAQ
jgi:hypothetical protein